MTNIENYMHDGANWQAQSVLAYLRATKNVAINKTWNKEYKCYDASVEVDRYENCREQGYIFSVRYKRKQRNYCVYEHRNSDDLCVVVFDAVTLNTPTNDMLFEAMGDSKWNYTKAFPCGQIVECGDYILDNMKKWINGLIKNGEDYETDEHWQDVRERAAIAAMQGMLANPELMQVTDWDGREYKWKIEKQAIFYADALIEELKKK